MLRLTIESISTIEMISIKRRIDPKKIMSKKIPLFASAGGTFFVDNVKHILI